MDFKILEPSDRELLEPYLARLSFVDTGFTALYYIVDQYRVRYAFLGDTLAIAYDFPDGVWYTLFGTGDLPRAARELSEGGLVRFLCVPEVELDAYRSLPGYTAEISCEEIYTDYVCRYEDFVSMRNANGHRKCRDYARFTARNDCSVREISGESLGDVRELMERWCAPRDCADCHLGCEKSWIFKLLDAWDELPARGLIVDIDGKPEGFDVAELCGDTMLRLVGKPVGRQEGLHVFMGVQTALRQFSEAAYVNSGPDLGVPGLALMKQKFKPYALLKKYFVTLREDTGENEREGA